MSARSNLHTIGRRLSWVAMLVVMTPIIAFAHGGMAAANETSDEKVHSETGATATAASPIVLAGRWSGHRFGYAKVAKADGCKGGSCTLTFDIVPCGTEWCGIAVNEAQVCGAVALKLKGSPDPDRRNAFGGPLELAKGSDPYTIEAWYRAPEDDASENSGKPALSLIGDTGPELLMLRRSFPLQAELTRVSDATCTLEKATS